MIACVGTLLSFDIVLLTLKSRQRYTTDLPNGSTQSHFGCVVATAFALETAILYSTIRGLYMDSSWRNKNALRCPVTIISTLNDHHHMIPGVFELRDPLMSGSDH